MADAGRKEPRPIRRLDEAVVNRIAAGEIIIRPANALKELIENSLDAGSTQIQILVKDGGLKLLQIHDNGHGIRKEDLNIVCERFTTSKLEKFEDLSKIATYGFRGEALASISHVAHLTITSKTADSKCAYRAYYSDGKLASSRPGASAEPKPCAGNNGTQVTAEDLFYNVPIRRNALRSPSDEYNRILDVVSRYAVHNAGVSFSCKKQGSNAADVHTSSGASTVDNIRQIYGTSVASELLEVEKEFPNYDFKLRGYVTNANYNMKSMKFLLFINHRSVDCTALKRTIESVYNVYLPKGSHPFIYLSLEINPRKVDVNVHPTKSEVHFLNEEEVIASVGEAIQERLAGANSSRTFLAQTILPSADLPMELPREEREAKKGPLANDKVLEYKMVRTDTKSRSLDRFFHPSTSEQEPRKKQKVSREDEDDFREIGEKSVSAEKEDVDMDEGDETTAEENEVGELNMPAAKEKGKRTRVEVRLTSVLTLRKQAKAQEHAGLKELFSNHTFVGCIDDALALVQYQTKLYLINYCVLSEEFFYQLVLQEFCNLGFFHLSGPAPIYDLVMIALKEEEKNGWPSDLKPMDQIAEDIVEMLVSRREMLLEYFSMAISEDGNLETLPMLLKKYEPNLDKLPMLLLRLGSEVNWDTEKECFDTLSRELAIFYATEPPVLDTDDVSPTSPLTSAHESAQAMEEDSTEASEDPEKRKNAHARYRWQVEHVLFPALRSRFHPPRKLAESQHVILLTDLPALYRIFERC
ncbi:uncharacterized protein VTP21DRAFT_4555 [Calcarisporiella thermophila]|uniref:uncharacterized protein n=1 Tax=Calcarisporiella thermophila TaxID=911321 RepID=UPI003744B220